MDCTNVSVLLNDINVPENKIKTESYSSFDINRIIYADNLTSEKKAMKTSKKKSKVNKLSTKNDNIIKTLNSPEHKITVPIKKKFSDYVKHDLKINSKTTTHVLNQSKDCSENNLLVTLYKNLRFKEFCYVQHHDPGGCKSLHCYHEEVKHLNTPDYEKFVEEFLDLAFSEKKPGVPTFSVAVMHNGASHLPDLLEYIAATEPSMVVKRMLMGRSDVETLSMKDYKEKVNSSYSAGTYRCGPLLQLSMVGKTTEESGAYLKNLLDIMEQNHVIKLMMPWGQKSCLEGIPRCNSNDGPILWCRCGEQVVPTIDLTGNKGTSKKKGINELKRLQYLPRTSEARETVVEDRTRCHADQVGGLLHKQSTAAVGVLKGIHAGHQQTSNRVLKEMVCVGAEHFDVIVDRLKLDLLEPPTTQCVTWLDEARLNQLNREGIQTGKVTLRDNDVYFIPRNVVHQFRTITASTSVAWHVRLKQYHVDKECCCGKEKLGKDACDESSSSGPNKKIRKLIGS